MKEKQIKVLKVAPGQPPEPVWLDNDLTALQEAVSIGASYRGLIEIVNLEDDVCLVCNEEAKLIDLEPNRRLGHDILCGVFYVIGQDEEGELTSLSETASEHYTELFKEPETITEEEVNKSIIMRFFSC